jgi:transcriptional regulator with XRE-family HTH domain
VPYAPDDKDLLRVIGQNLRRARLAKGWSQEELFFKNRAHYRRYGWYRRGGVPVSQGAVRHWLGGGELRVGSTTCRWSAYNSGYGFGWEIEPVAEERGWPDLSEEEADRAIAAIEHALETHKYDYEF